MSPPVPTEWKFVPDTDWNSNAAASVKGPTHGGVVELPDGRMLFSTDGPQSLVALNPDGDLSETMAPEFAGIHSLSWAQTDGGPCLLCTHLLGHQVALLDLKGQPQWRLGCPTQSGLYAAETDFKPTAAVQAPDGRIFVADGYGASVVHVFDEGRHYIKSFGGTEAGEGQLRNCHGMALDTRATNPRLLLCDRRNRRLVHYDLDGNFIGTLATGLRRPCSVAFHGDHLALAELEGRVSILDPAHQSVTVLGDNPNEDQWANYEVPREQWRPGVFNAPHSVAFDSAGNLYVSEWSRTGRISKLRSASGDQDR